MDHDEPRDIDILLHGNFHYFVLEDAEDLRRRLGPYFQPRFRVNSDVVHYYIPPGEPPPADIIINIGQYVLAHLDEVALSLFANALYDKISAFISRSQRLKVSVDIQIVEERIDPRAPTRIDPRTPTQPVEERGEEPHSFHGQRLIGRIWGRVYSVDAVKQLLEEARREFR